MSSPPPSYFTSGRATISPSMPITSPGSQRLRMRAREGALLPQYKSDPSIASSTSGSTANIQANLLVLPSRYAEDFKAFCARNPVPCSLLDIITPREFSTRLAAYADIRTDIPAYNVYVNGVLYRSGQGDIKGEWTSDHIGFLMGCSYSFEYALSRQGLTPRHMLRSRPVPLFISNIPLNPAGVFLKGTCVVSMRWYKTADIPRVREVTRQFARQNGEPIAWGWDAAEKIGVLGKIMAKTVDFGEWVDQQRDEVPVFWGSGVTSQFVVMVNKPDGVILSHKPG